MEQDALYFRAVLREQRLPYRWGTKLADAEPVRPVPGQAYLNATFLSTTTASPRKYFENEYLERFYNRNRDCCLFGIRVPAGFPVLPVFVAEFEGFSEEGEVLLPPGIVLIYLWEEDVDVGKTEALKVPMYRAAHVAAPDL